MLSIMLMGRVVSFAKVVLLNWNEVGPATSTPLTCPAADSEMDNSKSIKLLIGVFTEVSSLALKAGGILRRLGPPACDLKPGRLNLDGPIAGAVTRLRSALTAEGSSLH